VAARAEYAEQNPPPTDEQFAVKRQEWGRLGAAAKRIRETTNQLGSVGASTKPGRRRGSGYYIGRIVKAARDGSATAVEVLEQMKAGGYVSVRAAALAAGLIRPPDPVVRLCRLFERLTGEQKNQVVRMLQQRVLGGASDGPDQ